MIGQKILHYNIESKLGEGGMGAVYAATDTKLGRKVALKVLPADMVSNTDRRARFEREAQAIAALNHPSIVTVYSFEEANGTHFMTMELIEGNTLTAATPRQGMTLQQLFDVAIPLADALAAAHEKGIYHRDLKPDNVMITKEGRVKILDFGLAKLRADAQVDGADTILKTQTATAEGQILGTVAYMSPEQAEGKEIDQRSDIFSLGVMFYEMSTGFKPFSGDTPISTISSILRDQPKPVTELNPALPRHLNRIVRRCLAKDPKRRPQTALDVRNELESFKEEVDTGMMTVTPGEMAHAAPAGGGYLVKLLNGVLVVALVAVAALWMIDRSGRGSSTGPLLFTQTELTDLPGSEAEPSLSPDGKRLLYVGDESGDEDIYLKRVGGENPINLTADYDGLDRSPVFSPDGEQIAFFSEREGGGIFVMGATGESPRRLASGSVYHPAWSPDGSQLAYTTEMIVSPYGRSTVSELWVVDVGSGDKKRLYEGDAAQAKWSPEGSRIAFWSAVQGQRDINTIDVASGKVTPVTADAFTDWAPFWSSGGDYLYFGSDRGGNPNVWRVAIDQASGDLDGELEPVTSGIVEVRFAAMSADGDKVAYEAWDGSGELQVIAFDPDKERLVGEPKTLFSTSHAVLQLGLSWDDEWLAYRTTFPKEDLFIMRLDGTGRRQLTNDLARDRGAEFSPDGRTILFYSNREGSYDIWSVKTDGTGLTRVTDYEGEVNLPVWSPDGDKIAVILTETEEGAILELNADGTMASMDRMPKTDGGFFASSSWSPDGSTLAGRVLGRDGALLAMTYSIAPKTYRPIRYADGQQIAGEPHWFPDSRRLFIYDDERSQIVVHEVPSGVTRIVADVNLGGEGAVLSHDGRTIVFGKFNPSSNLWLLDIQDEE